MSEWQVLPGVEPAAAERFADLDAVFALEGENVPNDSTTRTLRVVFNWFSELERLAPKVPR